MGLNCDLVGDEHHQPFSKHTVEGGQERSSEIVDVRNGDDTSHTSIARCFVHHRAILLYVT